MRRRKKEVGSRKKKGMGWWVVACSESEIFRLEEDIRYRLKMKDERWI